MRIGPSSTEGPEVRDWRPPVATVEGAYVTQPANRTQHPMHWNCSQWPSPRMRQTHHKSRDSRVPKCQRWRMWMNGLLESHRNLSSHETLAPHRCSAASSRSDSGAKGRACLEMHPVPQSLHVLRDCQNRRVCGYCVAVVDVDDGETVHRRGMDMKMAQRLR